MQQSTTLNIFNNKFNNTSVLITIN